MHIAESRYIPLKTNDHVTAHLAGFYLAILVACASSDLFTIVVSLFLTR